MSSQANEEDTYRGAGADTTLPNNPTPVTSTTPIAILPVPNSNSNVSQQPGPTNPDNEGTSTGLNPTSTTPAHTHADVDAHADPAILPTSASDNPHEISSYTAAAESTTLTPATATATASPTLGRPEVSQELAAVATVPEDRYHQPHNQPHTQVNQDTPAIIVGTEGAQAPSYDSDTNTLVESTIEIASDTDFSTDTDSVYISDAVRDYKYENGRRYHGYEEGRYPVPNDEIEANREDMKHHGTTLLIGGKLHLAPISSTPQKVLDIGTGTGIWAMEFADAHPTTEVIGVDLSPIQPEMVPPNLQFEIDDVEKEWPYRPDSFDFIHIRYMFSAITDWPKLLEQCLRHLKSGGWVEVIEMDIIPSSDDGSLPADNYITKHLQYMTEAAAKMNRRLDIALHLHQLLADAGFVRVTEVPCKLPMGIWPKERKLKTIGFFHREQFLEGLQGMAMGFFTRALGWTPQEVEVFLVRVRKDLKDPNFHSYWRTYFVYAQKP